MGKTIAIKHNLSLYALLEHIHDHNIEGVVYESSKGNKIIVSYDGHVDFNLTDFTIFETFEVDIHHEVSMDCKYGLLVEFMVYGREPNIYLDTKISEILDDDTKEIHAYINGQFYKIFEVYGA